MKAKGGILRIERFKKGQEKVYLKETSEMEKVQQKNVY